MMHYLFNSTSLTAMAVLALSSVASAQNVSNEVWIGQTGTSNTISINQEGSGNLVGTDADDFLLRQDGVSNTITIDQYGWSNAIGVTAGALAADPAGFSQNGRGNTATINQENGLDSGSNSISTIYQASPSQATSGINQLSIEQSGSGFRAGAAGHQIGSILQTSVAADTSPNTITITQSGGGFARGNVIKRILQSGTASSVTALQSDAEQAIDYVSQIGDGNFLSVEQGNGDANTVGDVSQSGALNAASITQAGFRNEVLSVFQNNDGIAISGNVIEVMIAGDDNGGDGFGGVGYFGVMAGAIGAEQGSIIQIGDDNDIGFTVTRGDSNQYGYSQIGDGNVVDVVIDGDANEVASMQIGDDNSLVVEVEGGANVTAAFVEGERNRLDVYQKGSLNTASLSVVGDDNNKFGSETLLAGLGGTVSAFGSYRPGVVLQEGLQNAASMIIRGDGNFSTVRQRGDYNIAMITTTGSHNAAGISQVGDYNVALAGQQGSGNVAVIIQQ
ncbi:hypothetical protein [Hoeflea ulvae]|uniref:Curlin n=1 Tax=Hoeflea ulvae TaxID=2983764 RepID=A0ABT3YDU0_9HYPH|nr:hypothetical protein [Hoeflea ulvae]MCY0094041.1 hypothetical protein [Hoeflea ulvae]